jgi:hypothetical protein
MLAESLDAIQNARTAILAAIIPRAGREEQQAFAAAC